MISGQPECENGASDCPDLDHASDTENRMANATYRQSEFRDRIFPHFSQRC